MRTLMKNKQSLRYALQGEKKPVYARDADGNVICDVVEGVSVPRETGQYRLTYSTPVEFKGNISMSGGEAVYEDYGLSRERYDAVLVMDKESMPIDEASLIWHLSSPKYDADGFLKPESADYRVKRVVPSLNYERYLLERVVK